MRAASRTGYTWVEIVVVVCVLFLLAALLLPAVRSSRGPSRRNTCNSNMHNLALAVMNYASTKSAYPGYLCPIPTVEGDGPQTDARASWAVKILPFMERMFSERTCCELSGCARSTILNLLDFSPGIRAV